MNLSQSLASHGPELTPSTATSTAAACRRVFRRKNALRLPGENNPALVLLRRLTLRGLSGMVEAPNKVRRHRRLCRAPHGEKCGLFCFVSIPATGASCERRYILAERRPVSARTGGLTLAGERRSAFFYVQFPKQGRCFMISTILAASRPALVALSRNRIPAREVAHV